LLRSTTLSSLRGKRVRRKNYNKVNQKNYLITLFPPKAKSGSASPERFGDRRVELSPPGVGCLKRTHPPIASLGLPSLLRKEGKGDKISIFSTLFTRSEERVGQRSVAGVSLRRQVNHLSKLLNTFPNFFSYFKLL
jgi:hypothetical protein